MSWTETFTVLAIFCTLPSTRWSTANCRAISRVLSGAL
jgi:hypothetical protein